MKVENSDGLWGKYITDTETGITDHYDPFGDALAYIVIFGTLAVLSWWVLSGHFAASGPLHTPWGTIG